MPSRGSLLITVRTGGPTTATVIAAHTGWLVGNVSPTGDGEEVTASFYRYVGVDDPDAETQAAHFDSFESAVEASGWKATLQSTGVVIDGQTNPVAASALVYRARTARGRKEILAGARAPLAGHIEFAGTCFAFRHSNVFVTAAHCVGDADPSMVFVFAPFAWPGRPMNEIQLVDRHPLADLAVLTLEDGAWPQGIDPFVGVAAPPALASEFMAYGFPEDAPGSEAGPPGPLGPIARAFRGYVQRTLWYGRDPYGFQALEMSIPSPAGLSGGALFALTDHSRVLGMAVENIQSTTYAGEYHATTDNEGVTTRTVERNMVQYGIAVSLAPIADWLDERIPHHARLSKPYASAAQPR